MIHLHRTVACVGVLLVGCGRTELMVDAGAVDIDAQPPQSCGLDPTVNVDTEVLRRWNLAVDQISDQTPDFHWRMLNDFPHPTYRGGTAQAYRVFVEALLQFWSTPETLAFMRCARRMDQPYNSGPPVAQQKVVRLRPLTLELSNFSLVQADQREALAKLCVEIGC